MRWEDFPESFRGPSAGTGRVILVREVLALQMEEGKKEHTSLLEAGKVQNTHIPLESIPHSLQKEHAPTNTMSAK